MRGSLGDLHNVLSGFITTKQAPGQNSQWRRNDASCLNLFQVFSYGKTSGLKADGVLKKEKYISFKIQTYAITPRFSCFQTIWTGEYGYDEARANYDDDDDGNDDDFSGEAGNDRVHLLLS